MCTGSKPIRISHIWKYAMKIRNIYNELFNYFLELGNYLRYLGPAYCFRVLKIILPIYVYVKIKNKTKRYPEGSREPIRKCSGLFSKKGTCSFLDSMWLRLLLVTTFKKSIHIPIHIKENKRAKWNKDVSKMDPTSV